MHFNPDYAVSFSAREIDRLTRYIGNHMCCTCWCNSDFSDDLTKLNVDTQGFIYEKNDSKYGVLAAYNLDKKNRPVRGTIFPDNIIGL